MDTTKKNLQYSGYFSKLRIHFLNKINEPLYFFECVIIYILKKKTT